MVKLSITSVAMRLPIDVINTLRYNHTDEDQDLSSSEVIKEFLKGNLDLEIAHKEGCTFRFDDEFVYSENPLRDAEILLRIASMGDSDEHMALYKKHGRFHDGGDDFDYGGSFLYDLVEIIEYAWSLNLLNEG
jgi:hypothetical protein